MSKWSCKYLRANNCRTIHNLITSSVKLQWLDSVASGLFVICTAMGTLMHWQENRLLYRYQQSHPSYCKWASDHLIDVVAWVHSGKHRLVDYVVALGSTEWWMGSVKLDLCRIRAKVLHSNYWSNYGNALFCVGCFARSKAHNTLANTTGCVCVGVCACSSTYVRTYKYTCTTVFRTVNYCVWR